MYILDDMGVSKLSAKVFFKVNTPLSNAKFHRKTGYLTSEGWKID